MHIDSSILLNILFFFLNASYNPWNKGWQVTCGPGANPACHLFLLIKFYWDATMPIYLCILHDWRIFALHKQSCNRDHNTCKA